MARQTFPDNTIFANAAPEIDQPNASEWANAYESGTGKPPPKAGVHNYEFNRGDQQHQHVERNGVCVWDARTIYAQYGWCNAANGMLYQSQISNNTSNNPVTDDGTRWKSIAVIVGDKSNPVGSVLYRTVDPALNEISGGVGYGAWQDLAGMVIIGAGTHSDANSEEKTFVQGAEYGEYSHELILSEIPEHDHGGGTVGDTSSTPRGIGGFTGYGLWRQPAATPKGGGQSHNNIQPSIAIRTWLRIA